MDLREVAATHGGWYVREVSAGFTTYLNAKRRGRMCRGHSRTHACSPSAGSHTAWHQSACAQAIITRCLVDGTLPAPNTVRADEPAPEGS